MKLDDRTLQMGGLLSRGGQWGHLWTPNGEQYFSKKHQEWRQAKISLWFPLDREWPAVPAAWHDKNVYFGVHPTRSAGAHWQRSTIATIAAVNCVFAEFDAQDYNGGKAAIWTHLQSLAMFPTAVIDSGGGLHSYWIFQEPIPITGDNRMYMRRCQAAWVDYAGGDDGAKDLARVLRLPGFQNRKPERGPDFPTVKIMEFNPNRVFAFPRVKEIVNARIAQEEEAERQRIELDQARTKEVASGAAETLLDWAVRNANSGSRHNLALWLAGRLKAEGLAQWAASSVLREFARQVNKPGERQIASAEMDKVVTYVWSAQ